MSIQVDSVIRIPCKVSDRFFRYWFEFLQPFHKLTERETDIITSFVKHRYELSKVIKDDDILDRVTMSEETKRSIREDCKISVPHFQVILGKLKKNKVIIDNKINPRYIPNLKEENGSFKMLLLFDLEDKDV